MTPDVTRIKAYRDTHECGLLEARNAVIKQQLIEAVAGADDIVQLKKAVVAALEHLA